MKNQGAFCPKMGTTKDKNVRDLVDAEEIKRRWREYMEELYEKNLNEPDYYDGVVSYLESEILESKVKWALGKSPLIKLVDVNKTSGCD